MIDCAGPARQSWDPVVTMDFMATIMEVLNIERPKEQSKWHFDGVSVLPILKGETPADRGIGWMFSKPIASPKNGYGASYRDLSPASPSPPLNVNGICESDSTANPSSKWLIRLVLAL